MQDIHSTISTTDFVQQHIAQQPQSGLNVRQYCFEKGINKSTFYYWKKKQAQHQAQQGSSGFIELHPSGFSQGNTTVYFPNTVSICFDALPPLEYLKQLIF